MASITCCLWGFTDKARHATVRQHFARQCSCSRRWEEKRQNFHCSEVHTPGEQGAALPSMCHRREHAKGQVAWVQSTPRHTPVMSLWAHVRKCRTCTALASTLQDCCDDQMSLKGHFVTTHMPVTVCTLWACDSLNSDEEEASPQRLGKGSLSATHLGTMETLKCPKSVGMQCPPGWVSGERMFQGKVVRLLGSCFATKNSDPGTSCLLTSTPRPLSVQSNLRHRIKASLCAFSRLSSPGGEGFRASVGDDVEEDTLANRVWSVKMNGVAGAGTVGTECGPARAGGCLDLQSHCQDMWLKLERLHWEVGRTDVNWDSLSPSPWELWRLRSSLRQQRPPS